MRDRSGRGLGCRERRAEIDRGGLADEGELELDDLARARRGTRVAARALDCHARAVDAAGDAVEELVFCMRCAPEADFPRRHGFLGQPRGESVVRVEDARLPRREEQRALLASDVLALAADALGVREPDVGDDGDVRCDDLAEPLDLAANAHAALDDREAMRGGECKEHGGDADEVVQVAGRRPRLAARREERGDELLGRGLPGAARDRDDARLRVRGAPRGERVAREVAPRTQRIAHADDVRCVRQVPVDAIDDEQSGSAASGLGEERVPVVTLAAQRDERFAARDRARCPTRSRARAFRRFARSRRRSRARPHAASSSAAFLGIGVDISGFLVAAPHERGARVLVGRRSDVSPSRRSGSPRGPCRQQARRLPALPFAPRDRSRAHGRAGSGSRARARLRLRRCAASSRGRPPRWARRWPRATRSAGCRSSRSRRPRATRPRRPSARASARRDPRRSRRRRGFGPCGASALAPSRTRRRGARRARARGRRACGRSRRAPRRRRRRRTARAARARRARARALRAPARSRGRARARTRWPRRGSRRCARPRAASETEILRAASRARPRCRAPRARARAEPRPPRRRLAR